MQELEYSSTCLKVDGSEKYWSAVNLKLGSSSVYVTKYRIDLYRSFTEHVNVLNMNLMCALHRDAG